MNHLSSVDTNAIKPSGKFGHVLLAQNRMSAVDSEHETVLVPTFLGELQAVSDCLRRFEVGNSCTGKLLIRYVAKFALPAPAPVPGDGSMLSLVKLGVGFGA